MNIIKKSALVLFIIILYIIYYILYFIYLFIYFTHATNSDIVIFCPYPE